MSKINSYITISKLNTRFQYNYSTLLFRKIDFRHSKAMYENNTDKNLKSVSIFQRDKYKFNEYKPLSILSFLYSPYIVQLLFNWYNKWGKINREFEPPYSLRRKILLTARTRCFVQNWIGVTDPFMCLSKYGKWLLGLNNERTDFNYELLNKIWNILVVFNHLNRKN